MGADIAMEILDSLFIMHFVDVTRDFCGIMMDNFQKVHDVKKVQCLGRSLKA